mmetsp:Transcript_37845/g.116730  ORF Transcript_37845/g.116730 Transcript_37845/m.116730 type:complete len:208 (-) Transcript_37845:144-767(-)
MDAWAPLLAAVPLGPEQAAESSAGGRGRCGGRALGSLGPRGWRCCAWRGGRRWRGSALPQCFTGRLPRPFGGATSRAWRAGAAAAATGWPDTPGRRSRRSCWNALRPSGSCRPCSAAGGWAAEPRAAGGARATWQGLRRLARREHGVEALAGGAAEQAPLRKSRGTEPGDRGAAGEAGSRTARGRWHGGGRRQRPQCRRRGATRGAR